MNKTNGINGVLVKFMLATVVGITATGTGVFAGRIMDEQVRSQRVQMEHGERLSRLEAVQVGIHESLQRIDKNVNRLLERTP